MAPFKSTRLGGFKSITASALRVTNNTAGIAATSTGDIFTPGNGYRYHIFTQPGNLFIDNGGYVDYAVIAGGGSGGTGQGAGDEGGGGGAGGCLTQSNVLFPYGTYTIVVGEGGAYTSNDNGRSGNPSSIVGPVGFGTTVAIGGGYGAGTPNVTAGPGGSGGGNFASSIYTGGITGIVGQGNPGGIGPTTSGVAGGGGGGAGAAGSPAPAPGAFGGNGGIGTTLLNNDPGIPATYGTPGPTPGRWFAGGGGGGGNSSGSAGGAGGGGNGGSPTIDGGSATTNTGSGGGGAGTPRASGAGASGIVIIRYQI